MESRTAYDEMTMRFWITFFLLIVLSNGHSQSDWKLEKNSNGIKIYTRTTEESSIKEFKATTTMKAKPVDIAQQIVNVSDYAEWYPNVAGAKVLKNVSSTESIVYYLVDLPWPATDRDAVNVLKVSVDKTKKIFTITSTAKPDYKKEHEGVIRLRNAKGFWKLTDMGDKTKVHYQMIADPEGSLPAWIINLFIVDGPYDTLKALRERVE